MKLYQKKMMCPALGNKGNCCATSWNIVCESPQLLSLLLPFSWPQEVNFFPEPFIGVGNQTRLSVPQSCVWPGYVGDLHFVVFFPGGTLERIMRGFIRRIFLLPEVVF